MNNREFERIIDEQFTRCKDLLCTKQAEYTPDKDVFEVFNKASTLSGVGGRKSALFDFMLKHLVSISDMCHTEEYFTVERWNEKITDTMNYLLLLRAMVAEDEERTKGRPLPDPCGEYGDYSGISVNPKDCMEDCGDCEWFECTDKSDYICDMGCFTCRYKACHKHDEDRLTGGICDLDCNNCGDPCTVDEEQKRCQGECPSCSNGDCPLYWAYHSEARGKDEASDKDKEEFWSSVSTEEPIPLSERHIKPEGSEETEELFKACIASLEGGSKNF